MDVALIGAGLMGRPMAERLKAAGHQMHVYNRTREKVMDLENAGLHVADHPDTAIRAASCVILMLADATVIGELLLTRPTRNHLAGRAVIQMGTIGPRETKWLQQEILLEGAEYLEAPVLGSIAEARTGKLIVMVGASHEQFVRWADLLRCFGPEPRLIGPVGQAAALKLALNQLIAAEITAFGLSMGFVEREGIPVETFMDILRESALYAPMFDNKLPRLLKRDYANPNFPTKHMLKDAELFLKEAGADGLDTSSLSGVRTVLINAIERGLGQDDYSAVYNAINPPA